MKINDIMCSFIYRYVIYTYSRTFVNVVIENKFTRKLVSFKIKIVFEYIGYIIFISHHVISNNQTIANTIEH